ncbi:MAG: hypothetical protein EZS28_033938, partial [Streblomastix strix]
GVKYNEAMVQIKPTCWSERCAWHGGLPFGERISDRVEVKAQDKQIKKIQHFIFFVGSDPYAFCVVSQQNGVKYNYAWLSIKINMHFQDSYCTVHSLKRLTAPSAEHTSQEIALDWNHVEPASYFPGYGYPMGREVIIGRR